MTTQGESMALGREKTLTMSLLMTLDKANFVGNVHGGVMLKMLDEAAYACATRYAGAYVVTLAVDQVTFKQPVHIGELVTFLASVNYTGHTSLEIGVKVIAEDIKTRQRRHTNSCYFTMVALDEQGKSTPVPSLEPTTEEEKRRCAAAKRRRDFRREVEERHRQIRSED
jgi:acyl-CoA hydrolase